MKTKNQYTKTELRKYLSSALKELGAYGFGVSLEIHDAKLSDPEYKNYSWNPNLKDDELKKYEYGQDVGMCAFSNKKYFQKWLVEGVVLEIATWHDDVDASDFYYVELPTKSNPNKELVKSAE